MVLWSVSVKLGHFTEEEKRLVLLAALCFVSDISFLQQDVSNMLLIFSRGC